MMKERIHQGLRKYRYFAHLSDSALDALSGKLYFAEYPEGAELLNEGTPAEFFYLISKGEVEVIKDTKWGQTAKINVIGRGKGFGEMAFITCSSRYCSIRAKTDIELLKLHKRDFEEIVNVDSVFSRMAGIKTESFLYFDQLKTLQPFALLEPEKMDALIDRLVEKKFAPGENIVMQGETGETYYIIKSGKVAVFKKMPEDKPEYVATIREGYGFGEEAIITRSPRNATVKAIDETVVWTLSKSDFDSIIKPSYLDEVNPEDVLSTAQGSVNFLDVRMQMEFDEEHIPEAVNIPLDELRDRYSELDQSKEYHIYSLLGARSASAAFLMNSQGFKAKSIRGGILNWPGPVN
jgi:CRP-like cAMP-binding protein